MRFDRSGPAEVWRSEVTLDGPTVERIEGWCRSRGVSAFAFALHVTRLVLRAYSHAPFALGVAYDTRPAECLETIGMFVNTVLVPFGTAVEEVEELQRRWARELLPHAHTPYDAVVRAIGMEANTMLAFNVGLGSG